MESHPSFDGKKPGEGRQRSGVLSAQKTVSLSQSKSGGIGNIERTKTKAAIEAEREELRIEKQKSKERKLD